MRLAAFSGDWHIERTIEDVRAGQAGRFSGRAQFAPVPDGLDYREDGRLALGAAASVDATRRYLWRDGGASAIEVLFDDGRLFHRFYSDEPTPRAVHECPPDQYRVRYDFSRWPRWLAEWRVRGPRKDYGMVSAYRPAGQVARIAP